MSYSHRKPVHRSYLVIAVNVEEGKSKMATSVVITVQVLSLSMAEANDYKQAQQLGFSALTNH